MKDSGEKAIEIAIKWSKHRWKKFCEDCRHHIATLEVMWLETKKI